MFFFIFQEQIMFLFSGAINIFQEQLMFLYFSGVNNKNMLARLLAHPDIYRSLSAQERNSYFKYLRESNE